VFTEAGMMEVVVTTGATRSFFTGWMPFLSPSQQCQSTEGKTRLKTVLYFLFVYQFVVYHGPTYVSLNYHGMYTAINANHLPVQLTLILQLAFLMILK